MINAHSTARTTRLPRNPNNFRHRDPEWDLTRQAVDTIVSDRARADRLSYVERALDRHLDVCDLCGARRQQSPLCPCCGAVRAAA